MELSRLIYPNMRAELIEHLSAIKNSNHLSNENDIDEAIHFLFDDTSLSRNPEKAIGYFLISEEEGRIIFDLTSSIDSALNKYGESFSIQLHFNSAEWKMVIEKADGAHKLIVAKNSKQ